MSKVDETIFVIKTYFSNLAILTYSRA